MIYLVEYSREQSKLIRFEEFDERSRHEVDEKRLDLELRLNSLNLKHEVVTLEADSKEALKETHGRYFATLDELAHRIPK